MGDKRNVCRLLMGKPEGNGPIETPDIRRWIILKWMLERHDGVVWTG
jgi:hypothetical protein